MAEPVEFDCSECRRHVFHFGPAPAEPRRCATYLNVPGWYRDAELRVLFEPDPTWVPPS